MPREPTGHKHKAIPEQARDYAWIYCVTRKKCLESPERRRAHGSIMRIDTCVCGMTRQSEINQGRVNYSRWGLRA